MQPENNGKSLRHWWPVGVVLVLFATYGAVVLLHGWPFHGDSSERGQLGDAFGALTSLFTGLAFAALLVQIRLQSIELRLQREELAAQRREVKRMADEQERTVAQMAEQTLMSSVAALVQTEAFVMRHSTGTPSDDFQRANAMLRGYVAEQLAARTSKP